jgi:hypothetical protein
MHTTLGDRHTQLPMDPSLPGLESRRSRGGGGAIPIRRAVAVRAIRGMLDAVGLAIIFAVLLVTLAATTAFGSGTRTITTFAGSPRGLYGSSGDGGPAAAASLFRPTGVAADAHGDIFVVDEGNHRIRKIGPEGVITTIAGSGEPGYLGDGFPATSARLSPESVAVDKKGDVYIGDCEHSVVRKVDPEGKITTFAGNGTAGFSGDEGPATAAKLHCPIGLAIDDEENLYIADRENRRVRKVTPEGTITTFAGDGSNGPSGDGGQATSAAFDPEAMTVDSHDNVYIADAFANNVRKIDSSGIITTIAGAKSGGFGSSSGDGGPATSASLNYPAGVTVDKDGNVFIMTLCRVREVDTAGTITTIAGTEYCGLSGDGCASTLAQFYGAEGGVPIAVTAGEEGNIFFADYGANNVREILTTEPPASCTAGPVGTPIATPISTPIASLPNPISKPRPPAVTTIPKSKSKPISAVSAFSLPPAKQCVSNRKFTIHVRKLPGITWVSAVIEINHKRVKAVGHSRITALVSLVGLPKGTFVLSITAKASDGRSVTGTRTYHTCVPKRKSHATPRL